MTAKFLKNEINSNILRPLNSNSSCKDCVSTNSISSNSKSISVTSNNAIDQNTESLSKYSLSIKTVSNDDVNNEDDEGKFLCGFGSCTPKWLQQFHTAKWLLTMLGIAAFVQSFVVNSTFPVGLSTIEKRFHMTSTQTGIISSWYDFAVLIAVFPVCNLSNNSHKGRWIGYGAFLMGFGSFICALPHFIIEPYNIGSESYNESNIGQCTSRQITDSKCLIKNDEETSYINPYFLIFLVGQTFHGVGSTPLFSIGTTYLDENVSQKASPVYLAIHGVVTTIGPVFGFFVGGSLLKIYTDFERVNMNSVTLKGSEDPRWIGAWWIGFLVCAVAAIINAIPILMFARELPEAKRHRLKDVNQVHALSQVDETDDILKGKLKDLPQAIWNILRNPTIVTCIVLGIFESIVINGFSAFMPKILETTLSTTPTNAPNLASVVIFAAATGVMIGGLLIRKMNLQVGGMLKMIFFCHLIALILMFCFLIQCPTREFVGITVGYNEEKINSIHNNCNANCSCNLEWNPVCNEINEKTYYSACFAGCKTQKTIDNINYWEDCQCISSFENQTSKNKSNYTTELFKKKAVKSGFCTKKCGVSMYIFLVLLFFSVVASFAAGIPAQQIMLRVIPFQQRTLGIGVHWTFLRLLGFIPGGVLFGIIIDTACLKWQESKCGSKQSCLVYDPYKLSWTIMAVAVVCKLVSILATIIGYMTYRPNDLDNGASVQTTDSCGPLSLTVNDDRVEQNQIATSKNAKKTLKNLKS